MANVHNWQIGREMNYPYDASVSAPPVRLRLQHQPLHRLPELHHGLQVHLDVQQGPGAHVVGQRRNQTVRRLPAVLGRKNPRPIGEGQSRQPTVVRQTIRRQEKTLRAVRRQDDFRSAKHAGSGQRASARLSADRRGMEFAEHFRRQSGRARKACATSSTKKEPRSPNTRPGSSISRASAITAAILPAWRPARARRSTNAPKTASS